MKLYAKQPKRWAVGPNRNEAFLWGLRFKYLWAPWRYNGIFGDHRAQAAQQERFYDKRDAGWAIVKRFESVGHRAWYTPFSCLNRGLGFRCETLRRKRLLRGNFNRHNDDPTYHVWGEAVRVLRQLEARHAGREGEGRCRRDP